MVKLEIWQEYKLNKRTRMEDMHMAIWEEWNNFLDDYIAHEYMLHKVQHQYILY